MEKKFSIAAATMAIACCGQEELWLRSCGLGRVRLACHRKASCGVTWFMKTTITSLCLVLSLGLGFSKPALADRGGYEGGGYRGGYYAPAAQQRHHNHGGYYGGGSYRGYGWVGPAAALALTGIAVGVAASNYYSPPPVYVAQPQVVYCLLYTSR